MVVRDLNAWIDRELIPRLSLGDVFEGLEFHHGSGEARARCPSHGGDNPTSFCVNEETLLWHCFSCGKGGNAIQYRELRYDLPVAEALKELRRIAHLELPSGWDTRKPRDATAAPFECFFDISRSFLFDGDFPEGREYLVATRRLPEASLSRLEIGYVPTIDELRRRLRAEGCDLRRADETGLLHPQWSGRVIGPWRDAQEQIGTFWGRGIREGVRVKYFYLPRARRSHLPLYGFSRLRRRGRSRVVIVEGFFDALHLHAVGFPEAVAVGGMGGQVTSQRWS